MISVFSATGNELYPTAIVRCDSSPHDYMNETPAWFDRSFAFPYPAKLLPPLLTRLRGTAARLEEVTRSSSLTRLAAKTGSKWSAQEHAGHMLDLEALWLARLDDYVSGRDKLTAADLTNRKTNDAAYNQVSLDDILTRFRAARDALVRRVHAIDASLFPARIPHPRLGVRMTLVDHLYFVAEHDDHHLATIWSLCQQDTP
jgi:uncharacterized damage-inducible protein DinB